MIIMITTPFVNYYYYYMYSYFVKLHIEIRYLFNKFRYSTEIPFLHSSLRHQCLKMI